MYASCCLGSTARRFWNLLTECGWWHTHSGPKGRTLLAVGGWGAIDDGPYPRLLCTNGKLRRNIPHNRATLLAALSLVSWGSVVVELPCRYACHDRVRHHEHGLEAVRQWVRSGIDITGVKILPFFALRLPCHPVSSISNALLDFVGPGLIRCTLDLSHNNRMVCHLSLKFFEPFDPPRRRSRSFGWMFTDAVPQ